MLTILIGEVTLPLPDLSQALNSLDAPFVFGQLSRCIGGTVFMAREIDRYQYQTDL
jgi:hypothetical protein